MFRRMNPIVRALVMAVVFAGAILVAQYIRDVTIEHVEFAPNWIIVGVGALLSFAASMVTVIQKR